MPTYVRDSGAWKPVSGSSGDSLPNQSGNSGKYLTTNGTSASWATLAVASGITDANVFTSSSNWTCPAGITKVLAVVIGGGGGAAEAGFEETGDNGGYGGYGAGVLTVTPGTVYTVTVGSGGSPGLYPVWSGGTGGTSTFSTISATGGSGGVNPFGNDSPSGSCSSASATLRRSNVGNAIPFLINGATSIYNPYSNSERVWEVTSSYSPGARGLGTGSPGGGGAVLLFY